MTDGHRVTLTFNLYASRGSGMLADSTLNMNANQLPLYGPLKNMLDNPGFLREGDRLGIYLAHSYPLSEKSKGLPHCLKGVDMLTYEASRAVGFDVDIVHVLGSTQAEQYF